MVKNSAVSYCDNLGMRLPTLNETKAKTSLGVPSASFWTWTSSSCGNTCVYQGTSYKENDDSSYTRHAICVK
jgi:hypothetical protein